MRAGNRERDPMQKGIAYFATAVVVLVLIKDGTLPQLAKDAATGIGDLSKGLKPVTTIA